MIFKVMAAVNAERDLQCGELTGKKAFQLLSRPAFPSLLCGILNSLICSALSPWIAALFGYLLRDGCFAVLIVPSWQRDGADSV